MLTPCVTGCAHTPTERGSHKVPLEGGGQPLGRNMIATTRSLELRLALLTCSLLAALFLVYALLGRPSGGQPLGHALGIAGTLLMVTTETLYSLRKRTTWLRAYGPVRWWLSAHIFTGIVGPYMVLLHTSWKFNGLAGATTLLTVIIVISGFTGRYIYTRIPRSLEGIELTDSGGQAQAAVLTRSRQMLATWHAIHIPIGIALFVAAFIHIGAALTYATLLR